MWEIGDTIVTVFQRTEGIMAAVAKHAEQRREFSRRLRQARKSAGLSESALADRLQGTVTAETIVRFERGEEIPEAHVADTLAAALHTARAWLIPGPRPSLRELARMGPEARRRAFEAWPPAIEEDELAAWDATDVAELTEEQ